ncbi:DUF551 domain-containing protein [Klebsiella pneumoniae]|uniref:DUF551 domain-containing protein n=1 Tax=Klebsiella pneumoniae TaxID=573 RepID=UPI001E3A7275|nr:DUF551 domain-containing protein [Klebsiella pneumoniae]
MTKSTITRERAQQIFLGNGPEPSASEERELARMALAVMDSESGCLPLDYLKGHKDGLEWAARLAEANHPETGDWLYDDPIELAKAIRKGPDMPPAQPVADSEPVSVIDLANLDYLLSGADADVWPPEREEMGDVLLYRHAQPAPVVVPNGLRLALSNAGIAAPESDEMLAATCEKHIQALVTWVKDRKPFQSAPVVPDDVLEALQKVARIRLDMNDFDGDRRGIADCLCDAEEALIEVVNRRAAMLHGGNSPVVPDGYVMVPMRLTAENGAKGALSGEFSETKFVNCPECFGDDECETCDGSGRIEITVPVTWTTIKEIWAKGVEHFAGAPQEVKGE